MINRKAILNHNILTEHVVPATALHNNKAIVRLHKTSRIRLSNKDMRNLINDIKEQLLKILLEVPIEDLVAQYAKNGSKELELNDSIVNKNKLVIPATSPKGWKCLIVIYIKSLENLRQLLADRDTLIPKSDAFGSGSAQVLLRNLEMAKSKSPTPVVLQEEEEDDDAIRIPDEGEIVKQAGTDVEDTKKANLVVSYQGKLIANRGVDLVVLSRP